MKLPKVKNHRLWEFVKMTERKLAEGSGSMSKGGYIYLQDALSIANELMAIRDKRYEKVRQASKRSSNIHSAAKGTCWAIHGSRHRQNSSSY